MTSDLIARCPEGCFSVVWETVEPKPGNSCQFCGGAVRLSLETWTADSGWSGGAS